MQYKMTDDNFDDDKYQGHMCTVTRNHGRAAMTFRLK